MACCHTFPLKVKWCGGGLFEIGEEEEEEGSMSGRGFYP